MDVSMVFGIIFTLIVMGLLLVFGWQQIANLFGIGEEAQVASTIKGLEKKIDDLYYKAEGSRASFVLSFPKEYRMCFFSPANPSPQFYQDKSMTWNPGQTTKYRINQSSYNSWHYKGNNDEAGDGYIFPHLQMPAEKNFCATGQSKIYIVNTGMVKIEPA